MLLTISSLELLFLPPFTLFWMKMFTLSHYILGMCKSPHAFKMLIAKDLS